MVQPGDLSPRRLREARRPATAQELDDFETDVLARFVLARAAAGVKDDMVRGDDGHLEQLRNWFDRPLWEMEPGRDLPPYRPGEARSRPGRAS